MRLRWQRDNDVLARTQSAGPDKKQSRQSSLYKCYHGIVNRRVDYSGATGEESVLI